MSIRYSSIHSICQEHYQAKTRHKTKQAVLPSQTPPVTKSKSKWQSCMSLTRRRSNSQQTRRLYLIMWRCSNLQSAQKLISSSSTESVSITALETKWYTVAWRQKAKAKPNLAVKEFKIRLCGAVHTSRKCPGAAGHVSTKIIHSR